MKSYYEQFLIEIEHQVEVQQYERSDDARISKWNDYRSSAECLDFDSSKSRYSIGEFTQFYDSDLIFIAYKCILGRAPNERDFYQLQGELRYGNLSKLELLEKLRFSTEGKVRKVKITGLFTKAKLHRLSQVPVLGGILRFLIGIVRLPRLYRRLEELERQLYLQNKEIDRKINLSISQYEKELKSLSEELLESSDSGMGGNTSVKNVSADENTAA